MTHIHQRILPEASHALLTPAATAVKPVSMLIAMVKRWVAVARERRQLRALDDHLLRDIGIDRVQAEAEADRPFWDDPFGYRLTGIRARNYYGRAAGQMLKQSQEF